MADKLTEEALAPQVLIRYDASSAVDLRAVTDAARPTVGIRTGAVWARAERDSIGLELTYGALAILLRAGTVLFDARAGTGLIIVLRGEAEVFSQGQPVQTAIGGEALSFDSGARVSAPSPIDAPELARDTFVSLNLVLDSLAGAEVRLVDEAPGPPAGPWTTDGAAPSVEQPAPPAATVADREAPHDEGTDDDEATHDEGTEPSAADDSRPDEGGPEAPTDAASDGPAPSDEEMAAPIGVDPGSEPSGDVDDDPGPSDGDVADDPGPSAADAADDAAAAAGDPASNGRARSGRRPIDTGNARAEAKRLRGRRARSRE